MLINYKMSVIKNKFLITGATGFVGKYVIEYLANRANAQLICTYRRIPKETNNRNIIWEQVDLNDLGTLITIIKTHQPNYIIHLAAESSVGYSWKFPVQSFRNNINIFLNLLEAVKIAKSSCRILSIGSSESYGLVNKENLPLKESCPLNPVSPYAVARVSQELLSKVYIEGYGLDIVLTRSFNHFGPYQDTRFVIPSFVSKVIDRKNSNSKIPIETGNLSIVRDFLDVRDVVKAYIGLLEKGKSGEVYNISSGEGFTLQNILSQICDILQYPVQSIINPDFIRPNDNPVIIGDNSKLREEIFWQPAYKMKDTLEDIIYSRSPKSKISVATQIH